MTRLTVPSQPHSAVQPLRADLERVENHLVDLRRAGPAAIEVPLLLERAACRIAELEAAGADVRAERVRLEAAWQRLQRNARPFLRQAGAALRAERQRLGEQASGPWWQLDRRQAEVESQAYRRSGLLALTAVLLLVAAWLAYDRWLAPPAATRQALAHLANAQEQLAAGASNVALAECEAALALLPDDADALLCAGVLRQELGDADGAQQAYQAARQAGLSEGELLLQRGMLWLQVGNLAAARADAQALLSADPDGGYGFYLRAAVEVEAGNVDAAVADYQRAIECARAAGDDELEATATVQRGLLLQYGGGNP